MLKYLDRHELISEGIKNLQFWPKKGETLRERDFVKLLDIIEVNISSEIAEGISKFLYINRSNITAGQAKRLAKAINPFLD